MLELFWRCSSFHFDGELSMEEFLVSGRADGGVLQKTLRSEVEGFKEMRQGLHWIYLYNSQDSSLVHCWEHSHLRRVTVWDPVESGKHTVIPLTWLWVIAAGAAADSCAGWSLHKGAQLKGCCCAAKSLQLCPTLCDPIDGSPPGPAVPGILQARTLEWVAISSSNASKWKLKVKSLSRVRPSATPWIAAHQAPLSIGFSRQEYWSGVPLPSPAQGMRGT